MKETTERWIERAKRTARFVSVDYAYSTSENAREFGYAATGCWCVKLYSGPAAIGVAVAAVSSRELAIGMAREYGLPWLPLFEREHPELATVTA